MNLMCEIGEALAIWRDSVDRFVRAVSEAICTDVPKGRFDSRIGGAGRTKRLIKKRLKAEGIVHLGGINLGRVARGMRRSA